MIDVGTMPSIPSTTEFRTIPTIRRAVVALDGGDFRSAALLIERMLWNARFRAAIETRLAGLIATDIRWDPVRNTAAAKRAARDLAIDWQFMAPTPARKQLARWGLLLGIGLGWRQATESPTSTRRLFRLRHYWPGWARWLWNRDVYQISVRHGAPIETPSPADRFGGADPSATPWVIHEPFGDYSWREGLVHAAFSVWYGHDTAFRDLSRASEKYGLGMLGLEYPADQKADAKKLGTDVREAGAEGIFPLPQYRDESGQQYGFKLSPIEFQGGGGHEIIDRALNITAISMAILILGHNLTTEVKGGSYAAAGIGDDIRTDKKVEDTAAEYATMRPQIVQPWALENYGDPELAPIAVYVTDPPAINKARAETIKQLAEALAVLSAETGIDKRALCEQFRLPMNTETQVAVELPAEPSTAPQPASNATPPQGEA